MGIRSHDGDKTNPHGSLRLFCHLLDSTVIAGLQSHDDKADYRQGLCWLVGESRFQCVIVRECGCRHLLPTGQYLRVVVLQADGCQRSGIAVQMSQWTRNRRNGYCNRLRSHHRKVFVKRGEKDKLAQVGSVEREKRHRHKRVRVRARATKCGSAWGHPCSVAPACVVLNALRKPTVDKTQHAPARPIADSTAHHTLV